jgi:hypothetical protein
VQIWLYDQKDLRIEGTIIVRPFFFPPFSSPSQRKADCSLRSQGFDEFMNVVLDDASEIYVKTGKPRRPLGESTVRFFGVMRVVCANAGASWREDGP